MWGGLFPIACICNHVYGIDNGSTIKRLYEGYIPSNITLIPGDWFEINPVPIIQGRTINKVIIYGVLSALRNMDEVYRFIDKALSLLPENGEILLGDIPNKDKKERFLNSESGKEFDKKFREERLTFAETAKAILWNEIKEDVGVETTAIFNDKVIQKIVMYYHKKECDVYILPQKEYLPFGHTREDILIMKR